MILSKEYIVEQKVTRILQTILCEDMMTQKQNNRYLDKY